jgi:hypothetical protein
MRTRSVALQPAVLFFLYRFNKRKPLSARLLAAATVRGTASPHACADSASRVGFPFSSTSGPRSVTKCRRRNEPLRRMSSGDMSAAAFFAPGRRSAPPTFAWRDRPVAADPPSGSLRRAVLAAPAGRRAMLFFRAVRSAAFGPGFEVGMSWSALNFLSAVRGMRIRFGFDNVPRIASLVRAMPDSASPGNGETRNDRPGPKLTRRAGFLPTRLRSSV